MRALKFKLHFIDSKPYASAYCAIPEDAWRWREDSEADLSSV